MKIPANYRGAIYALTVFAMTALLVFGGITGDQLNTAVDNAVKLLAAVASALALLNVTPDEKPEE